MNFRDHVAVAKSAARSLSLAAGNCLERDFNRTRRAKEENMSTRQQ